jgi:hypothetical protein
MNKAKSRLTYLLGNAAKFKSDFCMFIVVYDGLACLHSFFVIFILTVFPTYLFLPLLLCSALFFCSVFFNTAFLHHSKYAAISE